MPKPYKKSAKDIAFDKERAKFRKELREAQSENKNLTLEICTLKNKIQELEYKIQDKDKRIEALMEVQNLSPEDLEKLLVKIETEQQLAGLFGVMSNITRHF